VCLHCSKQSLAQPSPAAVPFSPTLLLLTFSTICLSSLPSLFCLALCPAYCYPLHVLYCTVLYCTVLYCTVRTTTFDGDLLPNGRSGVRTPVGRYYYYVLAGKPAFSYRIAEVVGKGRGNDAMRRAVLTQRKDEALYRVSVEFPNLI
jgi:hypothetical protein